NKEGERYTSMLSTDEIFNTQNNVTAITNPVGIFIQDDYADIGLGAEMSRGSFVICEKEKFKNAYNHGAAWTDYLGKTDSSGNYLLPRIHINPYTGTMIEK
ncbi:MAG: hypothetical protein Q7T18_11535, partial [Sedimentisphaerales bacterium]|nr:hypothetical protein [Sedimentisphaerales bacterium]